MVILLPPLFDVSHAINVVCSPRCYRWMYAVRFLRHRSPCLRFSQTDLYLINPPPGVHAPIPPSQIVFNGGSAGGGLALALLQVLRDVGLPLPAGAVLVSPWTDLSHCFPSVFANTATVRNPDPFSTRDLTNLLRARYAGYNT